MQLTFFFQNKRNKKAYCAYVTMSRFGVYIRIGSLQHKKNCCKKGCKHLKEKIFP